jgi:hypothetical protein
VIALRPVAAMRRKLAENPLRHPLPTARRTIPLPTGPGRRRGRPGLPLVPRRSRPAGSCVLCPGGRLGLIWNARDTRVDWISAVSEILDRHGREAPHHHEGAWRSAFADPPLFRPIEEREIDHAQELDLEGLLERAASISYIAALPIEERTAVLREVKDLVTTHPAVAGQRIYTFPYRTLVVTFERI